MTAMQTRKWFVHRRIFADVESDDRGAESPGEGALGTADAAADIQHAHAGLKPEGLAQIMLWWPVMASSKDAPSFAPGRSEMIDPSHTRRNR